MVAAMTSLQGAGLQFFMAIKIDCFWFVLLVFYSSSLSTCGIVLVRSTIGSLQLASAVKISRDVIVLEVL
jgi:hypothetical protein